MQEILDFLVRHWYLSGAFVVLLIAITIMELRQRGGGSNRVDPAQLTNMINRDDPVIFDLRDSEDFQQGHVVGAKQASASDLIEKAQQLHKRKKPVVLVDADGRQASKVMTQLLGKGGSDIYVLAGGLAAWKDAGMPLVKSS